MIEKIGSKETKALAELPLGRKVTCGFPPASLFFLHFSSLSTTLIFMIKEKPSKSQRKTGQLCRLGFLIM